MSILVMLESRLKEALKSRNQVLLETVRLIKSTVKNKEIELLHPLSETEFFAVLSSMVKQRKESIDQFKQGGRADLVEKEEAQIHVIESFLPQALSDDELSSLIRETIIKEKATGPKDMGLIMKSLKDKVTGRVDGKKFSEMVKQHLNGLA